MKRNKAKEIACAAAYICEHELLSGSFFHHFDRAYEIAELFVKKYPPTYEWGIEKEFDEEIEAFTIKWCNENKSLNLLNEFSGQKQKTIPDIVVLGSNGPLSKLASIAQKAQTKIQLLHKQQVKESIEKMNIVTDNQHEYDIRYCIDNGNAIASIPINTEHENIILPADIKSSKIFYAIYQKKPDGTWMHKMDSNAVYKLRQRFNYYDGILEDVCYDENQREVYRKMPQGNIETFKYDAEGRLANKKVNGKTVILRRYNKSGRLIYEYEHEHSDCIVENKYYYNSEGELGLIVTKDENGEWKELYNEKDIS